MAFSRARCYGRGGRLLVERERELVVEALERGDGGRGRDAKRHALGSFGPACLARDGARAAQRSSKLRDCFVSVGQELAETLMQARARSDLATSRRPPSPRRLSWMKR